MFRSYKDLVRVPTKAQTSPTAYFCSMCPNGGWITENDVEIHKKDAHYTEIKELMTTHKYSFCTVCMTLHKSEDELIRHVKSNHLYSSPDAQRVEREIFVCDVCTNIFFNKDLLSVHMLYMHSCTIRERRTKRFYCPKCFRYCQLKSLWYHFQKHEIPSVSLCDLCLDNFPNREILLEHLKTHNSYYNCEQCGYTGSKPEHFEAHLKKHASRSILNCKQLTKAACKQNMLKVFKPQRAVQMYRYNVHNAMKGLNLPSFIEICMLCREICVSKEEAKKHLMQDHFYTEKNEKKKHICGCGEEFFNNVLLKHHVFKMNDSKHQPVDPSEHAWTKLVMTERPLPMKDQKNKDQNEDQNNEDQNEDQMDEDQNEDQMNEYQIVKDETDEDAVQAVLVFDHCDVSGEIITEENETTDENVIMTIE